MRLRRLTKKDVEFELSVEPEDIPWEGNAMASDDEEYDREYNEQIEDLLNRGFTEAWCILVVKASWDGYEGVASLGGNTFFPPHNNEKDFQEQAEAHGLYEEALDDLNKTLAQAAKDLSKLETK